MIETATLPEALEITCKNCGAELVLEAHLRTAECPYCASTSIVERPSSGVRVDPTFALGFVVERERARALATQWIKSRGIFTKSDFKKAIPERGRGLYMPVFLYGAIAHTTYECDIGENYTETYTTIDSKGRPVTRTRTVTEWRSLAGRHTTYVQDVLVTASRGIPNALLEKVEPFDLRALRRYTPALLSGWIAEEASVSSEECRKLAHDESLENVGRELDGFMPGDHHRNLRYQTRLEDEVSELVLLPVWVFAVRPSETEDPIQILVNGQTSEVAGDVPRSWVKIVAGVLVGIGLAFLVWIVIASLFLID